MKLLPMNLWRLLLLLPLTMPPAFGQAAGRSKAASKADQPEAMIRSFYREVVARRPHGIPEGRDMKILAPYLSKALLRRIDVVSACYRDWLRQNPDSNLKAPFGLFEDGLFSGANERASPTQFQIERTQPEKDGSFVVYLRLTLQEPPPEVWRVAAVVQRENGHFVVDDVIYLKDENRLIESRLSEDLSAGCDGPRWVGHRGSTAPKETQPEALIRSLYREVVARQPRGVPVDADMKIFAPYLSNALLQRIDVNIACQSDYYRQYPEPHTKSPFSEDGLFSGSNERSSPQAFLIQRTQAEKNGAFRVYVRLTRAYPEGRPLIWRVAAIVIREDGHLVVDDIIYLKDEEYEEDRLAEYLIDGGDGCDGPRWVGFEKQSNDPAPPKQN
jgi:hypothetical protein